MASSMFSDPELEELDAACAIRGLYLGVAKRWVFWFFLGVSYLDRV